MNIERKKIRKSILNDLNKKMVFITGPRQTGKTFLSKSLMKNFKKSIYLNYDNYRHREIIQNYGWLDNTDYIIFDELHKMPDWKNYIKGVFDTKQKNLKIIVTGSARLDIYRQSGDSLAGKYFLYHLLPFSLSELKFDGLDVSINKFLSNGSFPEPFLAKNKKDISRWRKQYIDVLLREEVLNFEKIDKLQTMRLLLELLMNKVGSPISYKSLSEDLHVSPNTVKRYVSILENLYIIFKITPFSKNIARSIKKEPKIYFFDSCMVGNGNGPKFENFLAFSLFKHAKALNDFEGKKVEIHYLRTKEKKEVDFCIVENNKIKTLIESKLSSNKISDSLIYFNKKYKLKSIQLVKNLQMEYKKNNINILKAENYLKDLYL